MYHNLAVIKNDLFVLAINCSAVGWQLTNSTIQAFSIGEAFSHVSADNGSQPHNVSRDPGGSVLLWGLYPGATYDLSVTYGSMTQCQHKLTLRESIEFRDTVLLLIAMNILTSYSEIQCYCL